MTKVIKVLNYIIFNVRSLLKKHCQIIKQILSPEQVTSVRSFGQMLNLFDHGLIDDLCWILAAHRSRETYDGIQIVLTTQIVVANQIFIWRDKSCF